MLGFGYRAWWQPTHAPLAFSPKVTGEAGFAAAELIRGFSVLFNVTPSEEGDYTLALALDDTLGAEAYTLVGSPAQLVIRGGGARGLLYGVYVLLGRLCLGRPVETTNVKSAPAVAHRVLTHTDCPTGVVEHSHAGWSLFFKDGKLGYDLPRLTDYARLLASVGINEAAVNHINEAKLPDLAKVAEVFRPFGIRLVAGVAFSKPTVIKHWTQLARQVYDHVPDLAGFFIAPPLNYRAEPAAINCIARALAPHGGVLYWRCAIDNYRQDWRNTEADRAKAAYEVFRPLDGQLDDNVILHTPHSPTHFQVREPNSPLLGAMTRTRQGLAFQLNNRYATAAQWEEVLDTPVTNACMTRGLIGHEVTALMAEANTGDDNWTGSLLAQANLYAFGRMAWNPAQTAEQCTREWAALTFGTAPDVVEPLTHLLLASRAVHEKYTTPLGLGGMTHPANPTLPAPESGEYTSHGMYHRATHTHIGTDRTTHGTEFTAQYHPYVRDLYENSKSCPEKLLLFFHRVPFSHKLKSGKTLLQHCYDTHFEGVLDVQRFITIWEGLHKKIHLEAFNAVREALEMQLTLAKEWRDVVNNYLYRLTGTADAQGRKIHGSAD